MGLLDRDEPAVNGNPQNDALLPLLNMFGQSMASTFKIQNIMGEDKFYGRTQDFEDFWMRWQAADRAMSALRMTPAQKFANLKFCVSSPAANFLVSLPPARDSSYQQALMILKYMYGTQQTALYNAVKNLFQMRQSDGTQRGRNQLHANIVSYGQSLAAVGTSPDMILTQIHIWILERKMDEVMRKDWVKYMEKRKDINHPLGYKVTFSDLVNRLHSFIDEQYKLQTISAGHVQARGPRGAAVAAITNSSPQSRQSRQQRVTFSLPSITHDPRSSSRSRAPNSHNMPRPPQNVIAEQRGRGGFRSSSAPPAPRPPAQSAAVVAGQPYQRQRNKSPGRGGKGGFRGKFCHFCQQASPNHVWGLGCSKIRNKELTDSQIKKIVIDNNLCRLCFMASHDKATCKSPDFLCCKIPGCGKRHNTLFHPQNQFGNSGSGPGRRQGAARE